MLTKRHTERGPCNHRCNVNMIIRKSPRGVMFNLALKMCLRSPNKNERQNMVSLDVQCQHNDYQGCNVRGVVLT